MDQSQVIQKVSILAERLDDAREMVKKLQGKARQLRLSDITVSFSEPYIEWVEVTCWDGSKRRTAIRQVNITFAGRAPRVSGWEFLAHVEHLPQGRLLLSRPDLDEATGAEVTRLWAHHSAECQHCNVQRQRKDLYILRELCTGNQMQVGRQCLQDFLGTEDLSALLGRFKFIAALRELSEEYTGRGRRFQPTTKALELACVATRLFGWCSKSQAEALNLTSTVSYVWLGIGGWLMTEEEKKLQRRLHQERTPEDEAQALEIIRWVREELRDENEYSHNLKVLLAGEYLADERRMAMAISAIAAWSRAKELELKRTQRDIELARSQHLGSEKERLRGLEATVLDTRVVGGGAFGECVLVKFLTKDGNLLTWFTGTEAGLRVGENVKLDGTVKRHTEYNSVKQTQLTRVRIVA